MAHNNDSERRCIDRGTTGGGCIDHRAGRHIDNRAGVLTGGGRIDSRVGVSTGGGCIDSRVGVNRGGTYRQQSGCRQGADVSTAEQVSTGGCIDRWWVYQQQVSVSAGGGRIDGRAGVSTGNGRIDSRVGVDRGRVYQQQGGHIAGGGCINSRAGVSTGGAFVA